MTRVCWKQIKLTLLQGLPDTATTARTGSPLPNVGKGLGGEGDLCLPSSVPKPSAGSGSLNQVKNIQAVPAPSPQTPPLTPLPRWGEGNRGPSRLSGDEGHRYRILQFLIVCSFLLPLCLDPGLDLRAQKQTTSPKAQRPRKPAAPAPVSKPKVKTPERPPVATTPQVPLANLQSAVTEARLQNGLKVLLQESHAAPLVSVGCWYRVGSKDDPAGNVGLSNLVRVLSLRDTESYSKEQTGRLMRETGGFWNSMTSADQTGFFETVPIGALEEVLKLEAARMLGSVDEDLQFRGERRRAIAAIHAREDSSRSLLDDEVAAAALQRHPYRWPLSAGCPTSS